MTWRRKWLSTLITALVALILATGAVILLVLATGWFQ